LKGKYDNKNGGRRKFQIDLGLALLNFAIGLEWDGKGPRPSRMQQTDFVPCSCKKCYFCLHGLTGGVEHKRKKQKVTVEYACGSHMRTDKCTTNRVHLKNKKGNLLQSGQYCKMCYTNQPKHLGKKVRKGKCHSSVMGCPQCKETICRVLLGTRL
jgi:hypothetical protein